MLPALVSAQPDRFALPSCTGPSLELANRSFFLLCYNSTLKVSLWAAHELRPEYSGGPAARPRLFRQDTELSGPIARNADYVGSGFSRGHLVPAEDLAWSDAAIRSTFLLSNAVPQAQAVNAGAWRRLEGAVRRIAASSDAVYVFTGPIFDNDAIERIGRGNIAVPSRTFKVLLVLIGGHKSMYAAILPNCTTGKESLSNFVTSVREVERQTGLDFFSGLEDIEEQTLELSVDQGWPVVFTATAR